MSYASENFSRANIRPNYLCCHPTAKNTGAAVKFELHPAHDVVEGSIFVTFAAQKTLASFAGGKRTPATFDWENRITVRLKINEIGQMLEVFRGYRESIGDGKGLYHETAKGSTMISLEHRLEPGPGYLFSVSRKTVEGLSMKVGILLTMTEAIVLSEALASSLFYMAFGIPSVVLRSGRPSVPVAPEASLSAKIQEVA